MFVFCVGICVSVITFSKISVLCILLIYSIKKMTNHKKYHPALFVLLVVVACYFIYTRVILSHYLPMKCLWTINRLTWRNTLVFPNYDCVSELALQKYKKLQPIFFFSHNYDTLPPYAQKSKEMINRYCKHHNYKFREFVHDKTSVSPYWVRVKDLLMLCDEFDDNAVFIYLDLDTFLNPYQFNNSIDRLMCALDHNNEWDMYIGKDTHPKYPINTGVMIIKNTEWSRALIKEWWSRYDDSKWTQTNGKWRCVDNGKECKWARQNYEQGELNIMYQENVLDMKTHVAILDMIVISNSLKLSKHTFIYHLMSFNDADRLEIFNQLADSYIPIKV